MNYSQPVNTENNNDINYEALNEEFGDVDVSGKWIY